MYTYATHKMFFYLKDVLKNSLFSQTINKILIKLNIYNEKNPYYKQN